MNKQCANCGVDLGVPTGVSGRVPAVAWMNSCHPCAEIARQMMELEQDRPDGKPIQIWRCRLCAGRRACRPGWRTRCHICLDERTTLTDAVLDGLADELRAQLDPEQIADLREVFQLSPSDWIDDVQAFELFSVLDLDEELLLFERPGWTIVAGDLIGMPWGPTGDAESHGIWSRHDACGVLQNVRRLPECATCEPEPGSRTHRARANRPQLLYLVSFKHPELGPLLKYGHGDRARVMSHLAGGAEIVCAIQAPHQHVVAAERNLRRTHNAVQVGPAAGLPLSFGRGSEVVPGHVDIALMNELAREDAIVVTSTFRRRHPRRR